MIPSRNDPQPCKDINPVTIPAPEYSVALKWSSNWPQNDSQPWNATNQNFPLSHKKNFWAISFVVSDSIFTCYWLVQKAIRNSGCSFGKAVFFSFSLCSLFLRRLCYITKIWRGSHSHEGLLIIMANIDSSWGKMKASDHDLYVKQSANLHTCRSRAKFEMNRVRIIFLLKCSSSFRCGEVSCVTV